MSIKGSLVTIIFLPWDMMLKDLSVISRKEFVFIPWASVVVRHAIIIMFFLIAPFFYFTVLISAHTDKNDMRFITSWGKRENKSLGLLCAQYKRSTVSMGIHCWNNSFLYNLKSDRFLTTK